MNTIVATEPFQKVAADTLELPITSRGNRYVLVVQDYFSKYVNLYAIPDQRATTVQNVCLKISFVSMASQKCGIQIKDVNLSQIWLSIFVNCWALKRHGPAHIILSVTA